MTENKEWRNTVKGRAEYIRGLIKDGKLLGEPLKMNDMDAVLVAAFLKGVEEGRRNSELVLKKMIQNLEKTN
jgi:hypothetical protein